MTYGTTVRKKLDDENAHRDVEVGVVVRVIASVAVEEADDPPLFDIRLPFNIRRSRDRMLM